MADTPLDFLKITIGDVIITGVEPNAATSTYWEHVTLPFARVKQEYTVQSQLGASSLGAFLVSAGLLVLDDPEGKRRQFKYAGFGMAISVPIPKLLHRKLTLPKITLKGREIAGTGSTTDFPSNGIVYETAACHGNLTPQKLEGDAIYFDGSSDLLYGTDVTVLLCGIKPELLEMAIMIQSFMTLAVNAAPAVIVVRGVNEGLQEGLGGGLMPGQIIWKGTYDNDS